MSNSIKAVLAIGLVAIVAACADTAPVEEYVVVDPAPISEEPTYKGKYK